MGVPESIRKVARPKNTVVVDSGSGAMRYAVRERSGVEYVRGSNPRPKNGRVVGHIVGGRYVPSAGKKAARLGDVVQVLSCGGAELALSASEGIRKDLSDVYGSDGDAVAAIALLRCIRPGIRDSRLNSAYRESLISREIPGVALSAPRVSEFLRRLGGNRKLAKEFLRKRVAAVAEEDHLAVDGTLKQDTSEVNDLSGYSFKSRAKGTRDISVLYAYDVEKGEAVCFDVYPGNMIDATSYRSFIEGNKLKRGIIVDDKGFPAKSAGSAFGDNPDLGFLTPLRRNDRRIGANGMAEYDSSITYRGRAIPCAKREVVEGKRWLYSYRDAERAAKEERGWAEANRGLGPDEYRREYAKRRERFGTLVLESNRDLSPLSAYEAYAQRWLIELTFRQYKQALDLDSTNVHYNSSVYGTELVNFVATVISQRISERMDKAGLLEGDSYGNVMQDLNGVLKVDEGGALVDAAANPRCIEMMQRLGLRKAPEKPAPKKRGRPKKQKEAKSAGACKLDPVIRTV